MANKLLHTPDGVRDIYGAECMKKNVLQNKMEHVFYSYGYEDIKTPVFEYFDIFSESRGSVRAREMFKFFDRNNETLVLRPDETPAIARCAAKYFADEELPLRLCYVERMFINNFSYQGRLKEFTQTGAELIGDGTGDGDAEVIAMVIQALKATGLEDFQIELGQVEFFKGLLEEAGMDEEVEELLRDLIENKNHFGVEELITKQSVSGELKQIFLKMPELFGSLDQIKAAKELTGNQRARRAVERLEQVNEILECYGVSDYVSYDLGMLSQYQYYTGIIFKAFTHGTGNYIVSGGRYDKLLQQFGKDAPAVGFAIHVDDLMLALSRQKIEIPVSRANTVILYETEGRATAVRMAGHFREKGMALQLICKSDDRSLDHYRDFCGKHSIRNLLYLDKKALAVQAVNVPAGDSDLIPVSEYLEDM